MNHEKIAVELRDLSVTFSRWGQSVKALDEVSLGLDVITGILIVHRDSIVDESQAISVRKIGFDDLDLPRVRLDIVDSFYGM